MQLIATPTGSTHNATIEFNVTFVNDCSKVKLTPVSVTGTLNVTFYANFAQQITMASSSDATCGAITYQILDINGNIISSDQFWIDNTNSMIKGLVFPNSLVVASNVTSI